LNAALSPDDPAPVRKIQGRRTAAQRDTNPKSGRLEPSSALNQVDNQDDDRDCEQEMDQTTANVAKEAKKPEHDQDDNYSPEHVYPFG
jgi:hypothetical protein